MDMKRQIVVVPAAGPAASGHGTARLRPGWPAPHPRAGEAG
ncbi:MAG TPA: hypothetical protein VGH88_12650 [Streptosporangiaceae bacterium]|jgi:hypothetical protein